MKNLIFKSFVAFTILTLSNLNAQDASYENLEKLEEVVISTKFPVKKENVGKTVVTISKEIIEKMPFLTVAVLLNQISGVEINGTHNNAGKNLGYYVRGGRNHQLLVLIDGIPVTDPSGINFSYDLNLLSLHQVESIEIMKGAASTLYGSGAAAGVINIILKKTSTEVFKGNALFSVGTNNSTKKVNSTINKYQQYVDLSGTIKNTSYFFSISNLYLEGMSEASVETNEKLETDPFQQLNFIAKIEHDFTNKLGIKSIGSVRKIKHDYDFAFTDSEINYYKNSEIFMGLSPYYNYNSGVLKGNLSFKLMSRFDENEYGVSEFESESIMVDIFNKVEIGNNWNLISGIDFQQHNTDYLTSYDILNKELANFYMIDPYLTALYQHKEGFNLNVGGRLNIHENYGKHLVYNINPSFYFSKPNTSLNIMASASSAYVTPSLYQLYSSYGNLDLTPEESSTYELGYDLSLFNKKLNLKQTYFFREESNKIGFYTDFTTWESYYYNQEGEQFYRGIENEISYKVSKKINLNLNHTFINLNDNNSFLIPKVKWNGLVNYSINNRNHLSFQYQYNGSRTTQDFREFPAKIEKLKSYQLVNLNYKSEIIANRLSLFANVNNLFNEDFVESLGYVTKGTNFNFGLKINF